MYATLDSSETKQKHKQTKQKQTNKQNKSKQTNNLSKIQLKPIPLSIDLQINSILTILNNKLQNNNNNNLTRTHSKTKRKHLPEIIAYLACL